MESREEVYKIQIIEFESTHPKWTSKSDVNVELGEKYEVIDRKANKVKLEFLRSNKTFQMWIITCDELLIEELFMHNVKSLNGTCFLKSEKTPVFFLLKYERIKGKSVFEHEPEESVFKHFDIDNAIKRLDKEIENAINREEAAKAVIDVDYLSKLRKYLGEYFIGNERQLDVVSTKIYNFLKYNDNSPFIIIGDTGTGKSYIVSLIGKFTKIDVMQVDMTNYTEAGYKGEDVDFLLKKIKKQQMINKDRPFILFLDEFDKKTVPSVGIDGKDSNMAVQFQMLQFFNDMSEDEGIDSDKILIILGGAFEFLKTTNSNSNVIGFNKRFIESDNTNEINNPRTMIQNSGVICPELMGRVTSFIQLDKVNRAAIREALHNEHSYLYQMKDKMKKCDIELEFTDEGFNKLVDIIDDNKRNGFRSIKNTLIDMMDRFEYQMITNNVKRVIISAKVFDGNMPRMMNENDEEIEIAGGDANEHN